MEDLEIMKETARKFANRRMLYPVVIIFWLSVITTILSPLLFIWFTFILFVKVILTCIILFLVSGFLMVILKKIIDNAIEKIVSENKFKRPVKSKSSFQARMEEAMRQAKENNE